MEKYTVAHLTLLIFSLGFFPIILKEIQLLYYKFFNKIFFVHFYFLKEKLNREETNFLNKNVRFYSKLNSEQKKCFDHRVSFYLKNFQILKRGNVYISNEMKLLITATLATLTFGYRNFKLTILNRIIIYPDAYLSSISGKIHKGEFNPKLKTLVFSWKDFLKGFDSLDDNINLGIHEFSHALHLNSRSKNDISSIVFKKNYRILMSLIMKDKIIKTKIIESKYFRAYAFKNEFELLAVIFEHFIETPQDLKINFPNIYKTIKKMLNFNFGNY